MAKKKETSTQGNINPFTKQGAELRPHFIPIQYPLPTREKWVKDYWKNGPQDILQIADLADNLLPPPQRRQKGWTNEI